MFSRHKSFTPLTLFKHTKMIIVIEFTCRKFNRQKPSNQSDCELWVDARKYKIIALSPTPLNPIIKQKPPLFQPTFCPNNDYAASTTYTATEKRIIFRSALSHMHIINLLHKHTLLYNLICESEISFLFFFQIHIFLCDDIFSILICCSLRNWISIVKQWVKTTQPSVHEYTFIFF